MRRSAIVITLVLLALAARPARAATEWVLILDTSTSMSQGSWIIKDNGKKQEFAAADPHRLAVIATLIFRSFLDPDDKLTILVFDSGPMKVANDGTPLTPPAIGLYETLPNTVDKIRSLQFNDLTLFTGPLKRAREILDASALPKKVLLLVTDGSPGGVDAIDANQARQILGLTSGEPPFEILSLALATESQIEREQQAFLGPLGRLEQIRSPTGLVDGFTRAYADSIRSRPETGTLKARGKHTFRAPKYVSDVMVALATVNRTGPFAAKLSAGGRQLQAIDGGDSGCKPANAPCHAYQVFKAKKDPRSEQEWTLELPNTNGKVAYGIILRYELGAEIVSMSEAKAGDEKEVIARLNWKGVGFNDPAFFAADDFKATLILGDQEVPLELRPDDGSFVGKITVQQAGKQKMVARFSNKWLTIEAEKPFDAEAWLPLELVVKPTPIDFGEWTGERTESKRCTGIDFTGSVNVDKIALEMLGKGLPSGYQLELPAKGSKVAGNSAKICLVAPGCCSDQNSPDGATLTIRGENPHYHADAVDVALAFSTRKTPFLTCWWRVIAAILGAILFIIIVYGFIKPHDFDSQEVIRLAAKEKGLARASGRRLRELPGGKRGFYRDASVAFDGSGGAVKPGSGAALILKATRTDTVVVSKTTIEQKDPRTRKWAPIDAGDGLLYLRRSVIYRVGEFCFRLG